MDRATRLAVAAASASDSALARLTSSGRLDEEQVKRAVETLQARGKDRRTADGLLLNENEKLFLMVVLWKIPSKELRVPLPLPHSIRSDLAEVCLFTKDEPDSTPEKTEGFYRKLLKKHGIKNVSQVISVRTLKTEYKAFEAKRRLLGSFDFFLTDARIRRLLPTYLGRHFYSRKKFPVPVNLQASDLSREITETVNGTVLNISKAGSCSTVRVGHSGMAARCVVENIVAVADGLAQKLPEKWESVKLLYVKTEKSVSLPIFSSFVSVQKDKDLQLIAKKREDKEKQIKRQKIAKKREKNRQKKLRRAARAALNQAPKAEAPETSAPPASAPETSVASASAPETSAPPASAPETSAPPASAPETSAPPASAPETSAPPASAPETSAPPASAPETSAPPASAPKTSVAPASSPKTSAPPASSPKTSAPPASSPKTSAPPTSSPKTSVAPASAPKTSAPPASVPAVPKAGLAESRGEEGREEAQPSGRAESEEEIPTLVPIGAAPKGPAAKPQKSTPKKPAPETANTPLGKKRKSLPAPRTPAAAQPGTPAKTPGKKPRVTEEAEKNKNPSVGKRVPRPQTPKKPEAKFFTTAKASAKTPRTPKRRTPSKPKASPSS
ncbi:ribosomal L1 domain-containing protein 1 [Sorex fumeus]|uniref:ribosomal L1 domain-containing protein 1 n=1 Tax=Sorex fumeus TaxID=62283 RepID=UPI0024AE364D|nr:ribosomal L1 domain-containing protein 1 [Sorex fumeus]